MKEIPVTNGSCACAAVPLCSGIGIVNALEVMHAYPGDEGLQAFREWLDTPDVALLGMSQTRNKAGRKRRRGKEGEGGGENGGTGVEGGSEGEEETEASQQELRRRIFEEKHVSRRSTVSTPLWHFSYTPWRFLPCGAFRSTHEVDLPVAPFLSCLPPPSLFISSLPPPLFHPFHSVQ